MYRQQQTMEFQAAYGALVQAINNINCADQEKTEQHKAMLLGFVYEALHMQPMVSHQDSYSFDHDEGDVFPRASLDDEGDVFPRVSLDDEGDVFTRAGLDYEELESMMPGERRLVLLKAGLNPEEFDF